MNLMPAMAIVLFGAMAGRLSSETMTMTTYYPSPAGIYRTLTTTQRTVLARDGGKVSVGPGVPAVDTKVTIDEDQGDACNGAVRPPCYTNGLRVRYPGYSGVLLGQTPPSYAGAPGMTYIDNQDNTPLILGTNNWEQVRVTAGGYVGIRTPNPMVALDVAGPVRFNGFLAGTERGAPVGPQDGGLIYTSSPGNYGGHEAVLTVADGRGNDADEIWIGPNTGDYRGNVQLVANRINLEAPYGTVNIPGVTYAGPIYSSSDERLKRDVAPIRGALEKVTSLRGVSFRWTDSSKGDASHIGLIAQDVENAFPQLVATDPRDGTKAVDYPHLVGALVEAIKEQNRRIDALQAQVDLIRASGHGP